MSVANQKELAEAHKAQRRKWGIPDDVLPSDFIPERFGECYFCHKPLSDYDFCYGCDSFICPTCGVIGLAEKHNVEDHRRKL
jgi:hypothetical protein